MELKEIAEKLKNISAKKLVIKGASWTVRMATADGKMSDQEKLFFDDLIRISDLTKEQVAQMLDEK